MMHETPSRTQHQPDRESHPRGRSGFLGAIFGGIGRKKAHDRESRHRSEQKKLSAASERSSRVERSAKKARALTTPEDALYAFLMAKHDRLGQWSNASQLPDEMFASIMDYAIDPALTVKKVFRDAPKLINLITNNTHRTLLQRHASDAITECIYGKPAKEVCVYKKYIAARNAALRAQPADNPPLGYSTGLQKRRRILKAGGIQAATDMLLQALSASPPRVSSIRSAVFALTTLTTDVERDGLVQAHVKSAGTVGVYMQAIDYAVEYGDNFTYLYIAHSLGSLTYDDMRGIPEAIEVRAEIVEAGVVPPLIAKLHHTKDSDMRYLGALLLANLACDIDHNGKLMEAGVVPVLLKCIMASPKDQRVQSNCITVLFNLSVRRPDCVKEMKKAGAQRVLQAAYERHGVNENCQILITSLMQQLEEWQGYVGDQAEQAKLDEEMTRVHTENEEQRLADERMSMGGGALNMDVESDAEGKDSEGSCDGDTDDTEMFENDSDYEYDMYAMIEDADEEELC